MWPFKKTPKVGDRVWWAPKGKEGEVSSVSGGVFTFLAGGPCETPRGKPVPNRYIVNANVSDAVYDKSYDGWLIGQGPLPKSVRGTVIKPEPIVIKGGIRHG